MSLFDPFILRREGNVIFVDLQIEVFTPVDFQCPFCNEVFSEMVQLASLPDAITCPECFEIF